MAQFNGAGQANAPSNDAATISAGIVVTGNVACERNLQISGRVIGDVRGTTVFVDETGVVEGSLEADQLRVCGAVSGAVVVGDLAIEPGGSLVGDVAYQRLKVALDGTLEGNLTRRPAAQSGEGETSLKLVQPHAATNPRQVFVD